MNIIHITNLSNNEASGISNVVPFHVMYQSKYTNILWFNINSEYKPPNKFSELYYSINDFPNSDLRDFPAPFSKPDLVIFHGIYFYKYYKIAKMLSNFGISYIVVPHGSLTKSSLKKKAFKKRLAFFFLFKKFLNNSLAIQYLTQGEFESSGEKWNKNYIIIPNGCEVPDKRKTMFGDQNIKGVFIGRKSIYHKGLDILLEACSNIKDKLETNKCEIHIYGPNENNSTEVLNKSILEYNLTNIIFLHDSVFGVQKEEVLLNSDFFVLTSRFEGHPVALIEALAYGIPCLITTGTNMATEVDELNAGWSADINIKSVEKALLLLLNERSKLSLKGENALKLTQRYSWDNIVQDSIKQYKDILLNKK